MKQIWNDIKQDFKERWPLAVLGALFAIAFVLINS